MKFKLLLFSLLTAGFFLGYTSKATAQCDYRLDMTDEYGDGWNGGILTVMTGSTTYTFTLNNITDDGTDSSVVFSVLSNEPLVISWAAGFFNTEVSFKVYNYYGNVILDELAPIDGILYSGTGTCPTCLNPSNFRADNIYDNRIKLRWNAVGTNPVGWALIYGNQGFIPGQVGAGDTLYVTQPKATVTGLLEMSAYDFYLQQDCGNNDVSALIGPLSLKTYWSDDVGIAGVEAPVSGCDLGVETLKIILKNHGANPQSLVPFYYSVNGVAAGIPFPDDGFYTGVLGKDSCELVFFDTKHNFSALGEYTIQVWTEMMGDDNPANDTFTYRIVNRFQEPYAQDFETWEGGWYVDQDSSRNASWQFGKPAGTVIDAAASGVNAWVTNLDGTYNSEERSYLNSPCFDFSGIANDPVVEFAINYQTESSYDGAALEISTDEGLTWEKLGAQGEGINWYNNTAANIGLGDVWGGNSNGWINARHSLVGMAGKSPVRLRFVFGSDISTQQEGVGIDNVKIYVPLSKDLAAIEASSAADGEDCGLANDHVVFRLANLGYQPQSTFKVAYSINGGAPVIENVTAANVAPDEIFEYTFTAAFDSRDGLFNIRAWTLLNGELNFSNDTSATYVVDHRPLPVPLFENFQSGAVPAGWMVEGTVTNQHNNTSQVLAFNLYDGFSSTSFTHDLARYGIISTGDSLFFDYRITDYNANSTLDGTVPTVLSNGTQIEVQISDDCGDTYNTIYTIDENNHTPAVGLKKIKLDLSAYAGESIRIRFLGTWGNGDFWVDFDNINIRTCPVSMLLSAEITNTAVGTTNGKAKAVVGLGNPPYKYAWSTGATTQTASNLGIGTYMVTVTDSKGCSDVLEVSIGNSSAQNIESLTRMALQPNPTTGLSTLQVTFDRAVDVQVQVMNLLGQVLMQTIAENTSSLAEPLDLTAAPDGLYLVRVSVGKQVKTVKLVKGN